MNISLINISLLNDKKKALIINIELNDEGRVKIPGNEVLKNQEKVKKKRQKAKTKKRKKGRGKKGKELVK